MATETTFIDPAYLSTGAVHAVDGVRFISYHRAIGSYVRISEDGQIMTRLNYGLMSYTASVIGYGQLCGASGKATRFRSQDAAARAAIKIFRKMKKDK